MEIRKIKREEYPEALRMYSVCFEYDEGLGDLTKDAEFLKKISEAPRNRTDDNWDCIWAAFDDDGKMMSNMASLPFEANFDGHKVKMAGIGGVTTLPVYRQRGAVRACFGKILEEMKEKEQIISFLYPFSFYFYRKFGYEHSGTTVNWKIKLTAMPKASKCGKFKMLEPGADIKDLEAVYNAFADGVNVMTTRDRWSWEKAITYANPYESPVYTFIYYDDVGAPQGYFTFVRHLEPNVRMIDVPEFCFATNEAATAMLGFLGKYQSDYSFAIIRMPGHIDLSAFLPEYANSVERTEKYTGMFRVVDAERVLQLAKYKGEGRFTVKLSDDSAPWNEGTYTVEFGKNGTTVRRTDDAPDISADIQAFGLLISGEYSIADAKYLSNVTVHGNYETLENVFYRKPLWINDYF